MTERIEVSSEMLALVGGIGADATPEGCLLLAFADLDSAATLVSDPAQADLAEAALVLAVEPAACLRVFGFVPAQGGWHLPGELRTLALAVRDCVLPEPARATLRLAKCIELLCATMTALGESALIPAEPAATLSPADAARIRAAHRLIDERWREKWTLDAIARACGINRNKLTRGFRLMFDCSVADALAERRLGGARRMLRETSLPVSSIGYACGYNNNASFTRAFSRRFGMAPTRLRQAALAA